MSEYYPEPVPKFDPTIIKFGGALVRDRESALELKTHMENMKETAPLDGWYMGTVYNVKHQTWLTCGDEPIRGSNVVRFNGFYTTRELAQKQFPKGYNSRRWSDNESWTIDEIPAMINNDTFFLISDQKKFN